jgi:hypothetical protein
MANRYSQKGQQPVELAPVVRPTECIACTLTGVAEELGSLAAEVSGGC